MFKRKKQPLPPTKSAPATVVHRKPVAPKLSVSECLQQAQAALRKLRSLNPGDLQAFPLLNEIQRLVQQLKDATASLPPADRDAWNYQISDLEDDFRDLADVVVAKADAAPKPEPRLTTTSSMSSSSGRYANSATPASTPLQPSTSGRVQQAVALFSLQESLRANGTQPGVRRAQPAAAYQAPVYDPGQGSHQRQYQHPQHPQQHLQAQQQQHPPVYTPASTPPSRAPSSHVYLTEEERELLAQKQQSLLLKHQKYLEQQRAAQHQHVQQQQQQGMWAGAGTSGAAGSAAHAPPDATQQQRHPQQGPIPGYPSSQDLRQVRVGYDDLGYAQRRGPPSEYSSMQPTPHAYSVDASQSASACLSPAWSSNAAGGHYPGMAGGPAGRPVSAPWQAGGGEGAVPTGGFGQHPAAHAAAYYGQPAQAVQQPGPAATGGNDGPAEDDLFSGLDIVATDEQPSASDRAPQEPERVLQPAQQQGPQEARTQTPDAATAAPQQELNGGAQSGGPGGGDGAAGTPTGLQHAASVAGSGPVHGFRPAGHSTPNRWYAGSQSGSRAEPSQAAYQGGGDAVSQPGSSGYPQQVAQVPDGSEPQQQQPLRQDFSIPQSASATDPAPWQQQQPGPSHPQQYAHAAGAALQQQQQLQDLQHPAAVMHQQEMLAGTAAAQSMSMHVPQPPGPVAGAGSSAFTQTSPFAQAAQAAGGQASADGAPVSASSDLGAAAAPIRKKTSHIRLGYDNEREAEAPGGPMAGQAAAVTTTPAGVPGVFLSGPGQQAEAPGVPQTQVQYQAAVVQQGLPYPGSPASTGADGGYPPASTTRLAQAVPPELPQRGIVEHIGHGPYTQHQYHPHQHQTSTLPQHQYHPHQHQTGTLPPQDASRYPHIDGAAGSVGAGIGISAHGLTAGPLYSHQQQQHMQGPPSQPQVLSSQVSQQQQQLQQHPETHQGLQHGYPGAQPQPQQRYPVVQPITQDATAATPGLQPLASSAHQTSSGLPPAAVPPDAHSGLLGQPAYGDVPAGAVAVAGPSSLAVTGANLALTGGSLADRWPLKRTNSTHSTTSEAPGLNRPGSLLRNQTSTSVPTGATSFTPAPVSQAAAPSPLTAAAAGGVCAAAAQTPVGAATGLSPGLGRASFGGAGSLLQQLQLPRAGLTAATSPGLAPLSNTPEQPPRPSSSLSNYSTAYTQHTAHHQPATVAPVMRLSSQTPISSSATAAATGARTPAASTLQPAVSGTPASAGALRSRSRALHSGGGAGSSSGGVLADPAASLPSAATLPGLADLETFLDGITGPVDSCASAAEQRVRDMVATLGVALSQAQKVEAATQQQRRAVKTALAGIVANVSQLEADQAAAVEREDFETAAALDEQLTQLSYRRTHLEDQDRTLAAALQQAAALRLNILGRQSGAWRVTGAYLARLQAGQQQMAGALASQADREVQAAAVLHRAAQEALAQRRAALEQRHQELREASEEVDARVAAATAPAEAERQRRAEARDMLQAEVKSLRALLAAKEAALAAAESSVAEAAAAVRQQAAAFDGDVAVLDEARGMLQAEESQVAAQEEALQESERQAAARAAAVEEHQAQLRLQAESLGSAAGSMREEAEALARRVEAEARGKEQRERLLQADEAAREELKGLERCIADLSAELSRLSEQRSRLAAERGAAQEALATLQRSMPELEAAKRAAAASKDFREAARLSGELRALTVQADVAAAQVSRLSGALSELAAAEGAKVAELEELRSLVHEAQRRAAEAHHRHLVFCLGLSRAALDQAVAAEMYEEAGALQAEVSAEEAEALALERTWGFTRPGAQAAASTGAAGAAAAAAAAAAVRRRTSLEVTAATAGGGSGTGVPSPPTASLSRQSLGNVGGNGQALATPTSQASSRPLSSQLPSVGGTLYQAVGPLAPAASGGGIAAAATAAAYPNTPASVGGTNQGTCQAAAYLPLGVSPSPAATLQLGSSPVGAQQLFSHSPGGGAVLPLLLPSLGGAAPVVASTTAAAPPSGVVAGISELLARAPGASTEGNAQALPGQAVPGVQSRSWEKVPHESVTATTLEAAICQPSQEYQQPSLLPVSPPPASQLTDYHYQPPSCVDTDTASASEAAAYSEAYAAPSFSMPQPPPLGSGADARAAAASPGYAGDAVCAPVSISRGRSNGSLGQPDAGGYGAEVASTAPAHVSDTGDVGPLSAGILQAEVAPSLPQHANHGSSGSVGSAGSCGARDGHGSAVEPDVVAAGSAGADNEMQRQEPLTSHSSSYASDVPSGIAASEAGAAAAAAGVFLQPGPVAAGSGSRVPEPRQVPEVALHDNPMFQHNLSQEVDSVSVGEAGPSGNEAPGTAVPYGRDSGTTLGPAGMSAIADGAGLEGGPAAGERRRGLGAVLGRAGTGDAADADESQGLL